MTNKQAQESDKEWSRESLTSVILKTEKLNPKMAELQSVQLYKYVTLYKLYVCIHMYILYT